MLVLVTSVTFQGLLWKSSISFLCVNYMYDYGETADEVAEDPPLNE